MTPTNTRLANHLSFRPVVLNIETINICNARCCFCAYPKSERAGEVMQQQLFDKIVGEYHEMGGGALLLTPIVGDFFLDPLWKERLRCARTYSNIGMISLTTNAIALNRVSDADLEMFLRAVSFVQFSFGGLDKESYFEMFRVDRFKEAFEGVLRCLEMRNKLRIDLPLRIGFRVTSQQDVKNHPNYKILTELGAETAVETEYGNWGGIINEGDLPAGATLRPILGWREKKNPCFVFYLGLFVTSSGRVTFCGCMDSEVKHPIGDSRKQHLRDIWLGSEYVQIKNSFGTEQIPDICKLCSFYEDGLAFSLQPEAMAFESGQYPFGGKGKHVMFERFGVDRNPERIPLDRAK
jgi:MoaA/NifB/PqqE/SkfB family radical SAM enzyme